MNTNSRGPLLQGFLRAALSVVFLVSFFAGVRVDAAVRPACSFLGSEGDYLDRLKENAEAAIERGQHERAATIYADAAEYAYGCAPHDIAEYIAGKPIVLDVGTAKSSLWGNAGSMFDDAAKEARAAGQRTRACSYSRRALDAYTQVPTYAREMPSLRAKVKRAGC